jgi:hypothetical protein
MSDPGFDASKPHVSRRCTARCLRAATCSSTTWLVEPGVVLVPDWRPDPGTPGVRHHPVLGLAAAGVARKA